MVLPYVYKCVHKITNQFYFGFRCNNKAPSEQDIVMYKTSSNLVRNTFEEYDVVILAEFFDKTAAYDFEQSLIYEEWNNPLILNRSCFYNGKRFSTAGTRHSDTTKEKISKAKLGHIVTEETREKIRQAKIRNNELYLNRPSRKGCKISDETKRKISLARVGIDVRTLEHKEKLRQANLGKRWYNNGITNIKAREKPKGFELGRINKKRDGSIPL